MVSKRKNPGESSDEAREDSDNNCPRFGAHKSLKKICLEENHTNMAQIRSLSLIFTLNF